MGWGMEEDEKELVIEEGENWEGLGAESDEGGRGGEVDEQMRAGADKREWNGEERRLIWGRAAFG